MESLQTVQLIVRHEQFNEQNYQPERHLQFLSTLCKVIRVDTRTTNYKQSPTTINIDRPAYIKTDKQCRTRTISTARLPDD